MSERTEADFAWDLWAKINKVTIGKNWQFNAIRQEAFIAGWASAKASLAEERGSKFGAPNKKRKQISSAAGEFLFEARMRQQLTQRAVCDAIGIEISTLARAESQGNVGVTAFGTVARLCKLYEIPLNALSEFV